MPADKRSLIIAPQWIGDAVMTEPLLRRLHARGEQLTLAALPWVAPVYRTMGQVSAVIELPFVHGQLQWRQRFALARSLRQRFDLAYVCPNSFKSALLPWLARIPQRIGYLGEQRHLLLTQHLPNPQKGQRAPMVAFYSGLSGEPEVSDDRPRLQLDAQQVERTLRAFDLRRGDYLVFIPGAEFGPAKRWPTGHFAALARQLDASVLLLGAAKDFELCEEIAASANAGQAGRCLNLAGKTSLMQAFELLAGAHTVLSNDSGLMHVAAALGVAQVGIFGSSSPLHTPPLNDRAKVLWLKNDPDYQPALNCAPCFARVCPLSHTRCLVDIPAERVQQTMASLHAASAVKGPAAKSE